MATAGRLGLVGDDENHRFPSSCLFRIALYALDEQWPDITAWELNGGNCWETLVHCNCTLNTIVTLLINWQSMALSHCGAATPASRLASSPRTRSRT